MIVCQIISDTNIGGGGRALLNYLEHSKGSLFTPHVILPKNSALTPRLQGLQVPYTEIDGMADRSFDPKAWQPLTQALKAIQPDLVHTHGSLIGRMVARCMGYFVVYTKHCAFAPQGFRATSYGKFLVRQLDGILAHGVLAVGDSARDNLIASGIPKERIYTSYNGVAPLAPMEENQRHGVRFEYGFSPQDFVVGILARVEEHKGHETLLKAFSLLLEQSLPIKLLIAGDGNDLGRIKQLAQDFPTGSVVFLGFVEDVRNPLCAMDVQVNASYESETSSLSLLEGMSLGLPAVVSDLGGNPHLIHHETNGLVFPPQDANALALALQRLCNDPVLRQILSHGAKKRYEDAFTGERFAQDMEEVYKQVLTSL